MIKSFLLIVLIVFSLLFMVGCSTEDGSFNNPYSGTCLQGEDHEDCLGECGQ